MKKLFFFAFALLVAGSVFGQRVVGEAIMMPKQNQQINKIPTDTLEPLYWAAASGYTIYSNQDGGYVVGVNSYGDLAKAQEYWVNDPYNLEGVMIWFGAKEVISPDGEIKFSVWNMDGTTGWTTMGDGDQPCPGTVLVSEAVTTANVDTSSSSTNAFVHMFTAPMWVSGDYAIGADFSNAKADTIGIVSSVDGDGNQGQLTWEQWSDGRWFTMLYAWPLDFEFGIFPIVDISSGLVENGSFINGIKLQSYPNPAVDYVTVSYEISNPSNVSLQIYSMTGQLVKTVEAGHMAAGVHNMDLNVSDLSKGTYVYSLVAGSNRLTKRMIIE